VPGVSVATLSHLRLIHYHSKMLPVRELGRTLLILAAFLAAIGAFLYFSPRLPFKPGKLPGDLVHRTEHTTLYFPVVTCLILSAALSLIFWLINHFRR
jgi:hypothetical protein